MPGSGIFGTFGMAAESTWGTFATPTHFQTLNSETMMAKKTALQANALHGGVYQLASRRSVGKWAAGGSVTMDLYSRGLGLLFEQMIGAVKSSALDSPSTTVYKQIFTPAQTNGLSFTTQIGRPSTSNTTIQAMSYEGCKITGWNLGIKAGDFATLGFDIDAAKEDTTQSYTAPTYVNSDIFTAAECSLLLGGTPTTTSGVTSYTGGTAVPLAKDVTIKGSNVIDTARYVLGSLYKQEQLINGFRSIDIDMTLDFNGLTQCYNSFAADTPVALEFKFVGAEIDTPNSLFETVDILIPSVWYNGDSFPIPGPQIIEEKVSMVALDDGTNNPIQITYITLDTAV